MSSLSLVRCAVNVFVYGDRLPGICGSALCATEKRNVAARALAVLHFLAAVRGREHDPAIYTLSARPRLCLSTRSVALQWAYGLQWMAPP